MLFLHRQKKYYSHSLIKSIKVFVNLCCSILSFLFCVLYEIVCVFAVLLFFRTRAVSLFSSYWLECSVGIFCTYIVAIIHCVKTKQKSPHKNTVMRPLAFLDLSSPGKLKAEY